MSQQIGFWHFTPEASLKLKLYPLSGGNLVNSPDGTMLTATPGSCFYSAEMEHISPGQYRAHILDDAGLIYSGTVIVSPSLQGAVVDHLWDRGIQVNQFNTAALAQLAARRSIEVSLPTLCGHELSEPVVRGDAYLAELGRAIEFAREDFPDLPDGVTVRLSARSITDSETSFSFTGAVVVPTGTKVIRFEPTSLQTAELIPDKYEFDVEVEFPDGNCVTFVGPQTFLRVIADVSVP